MIKLFKINLVQQLGMVGRWAFTSLEADQHNSAALFILCTVVFTFVFGVGVLSALIALSDANEHAAFFTEWPIPVCIIVVIVVIAVIVAAAILLLCCCCCLFL